MVEWLADEAYAAATLNAIGEIVNKIKAETFSIILFDLPFFLTIVSILGKSYYLVKASK